MLSQHLITSDGTIGHSGVPAVSSLNIIDSTKLRAFMDSPRRFFYEHVLGWRPDEGNIHLIFGSAWHEGMEVLMESINSPLGAYNDQAVITAFNRFVEEFRRGFPDEMTWGHHAPKSPDNAFHALAAYAQTWKRQDADLNTLFVEVAGSAPIRRDRVIHFKMDTIVQDKNGMIWSIEHKTTGKSTRAWAEQWGIALQPWTYTHALRCAFPTERVKGVIINGAILRAKSTDFLRVPVGKSDEMMLAGLWQMNHTLDVMEWHFEALSECRPEDDVMTAFPCNSASCSKYSCPFSAFCATQANPLRTAHKPPPGFIIEHWNPHGQEDTAKAILSVDESGKGDITTL